MTRRLISSGSPFEAQAGYSRAVVVGDMCFVAGTTGYDYATMVLPQSVEEQTENAIATIKGALREAGFELAEVVRVNYIITERAYIDQVFAIVGRHFGDIRPAATMIVAGLLNPNMKIEIEATARHDQ
ncbi:MAG: RidA family protein [Alphaproteobacteria bacterium]